MNATLLLAAALLSADPFTLLQAGDRVVIDLPAYLTAEGPANAVPGYGNLENVARNTPAPDAVPVGTPGTITAVALIGYDAYVRVRLDGRELWFDRFRVRTPDGKAALDAAYLERIDTERRLREFLAESDVTMKAQAELLDQMRRESKAIWERVLENAARSERERDEASRRFPETPPPAPSATP